MLGTERVDVHIDLFIRPTSEEISNPLCKAYAQPSFVSDFDYREKIWPDTLSFEMIVSKEVYEEYVRHIVSPLNVEAHFSVRSCKGLYARREPIWGRPISTPLIKILTEHQLINLLNPEDSMIEPPVVGEVQEARLSFQSMRDHEQGERVNLDHNPLETMPAITKQAGSNGRTSRLLASLSISVWLCVILLLIIALQ